MQDKITELSEAFARLEGMLEAKLDSLIEEIRELKESDSKLHDRISTKDRYVRKIEERVSKLESVVATLKWVVSAIGAIGAAIGAIWASMRA